jgi:hypothetical protein
MSNKETAVEYLLINLLNKFPKEMEYLFLLDKDLIENTLNKAKEIEKQQIIDAYIKGNYKSNREMYWKEQSAKQYYNEEFNN